MDNDTIVAISTPPGEGGIGIIRLSGKESLSIGTRIFVPSVYLKKNIDKKKNLARLEGGFIMGLLSMKKGERLMKCFFVI